MDDREGMHCDGLFLLISVMMQATYSSATHWQYPTATTVGLEDVEVAGVEVRTNWSRCPRCR